MTTRSPAPSSPRCVRRRPSFREREGRKEEVGSGHVMTASTFASWSRGVGTSPTPFHALAWSCDSGKICVLLGHVMRTFRFPFVALVDLHHVTASALFY